MSSYFRTVGSMEGLTLSGTMHVIRRAGRREAHRNPTTLCKVVHCQTGDMNAVPAVIAFLGGVAHRGGAMRGMVTICELINFRPYKNQSPVYGRLVYTVIYMSDLLLTRANPYPHLRPPPSLCRYYDSCCLAHYLRGRGGAMYPYRPPPCRDPPADT
jgi:hypothetical protein